MEITIPAYQNRDFACGEQERQYILFPARPDSPVRLTSIVSESSIASEYNQQVPTKDRKDNLLSNPKENVGNTSAKLDYFFQEIIQGEIVPHATATTIMFLTSQGNQRFTVLNLIFASPQDQQDLNSRDINEAKVEEVLCRNRKFPSSLAYSKCSWEEGIDIEIK